MGIHQGRPPLLDEPFAVDDGEGAVRLQVDADAVADGLGVATFVGLLVAEALTVVVGCAAALVRLTPLGAAAERAVTLVVGCGFGFGVVEIVAGATAGLRSPPPGACQAKATV